MARVLIRAEHRADRATLEASAHFIEFLTVVDLQPNLRQGELRAAAPDAYGQCSACTMRSFLSSQHDLPSYPLLGWVDRAFGSVPGMTRALAGKDAASLRSLAGELGSEALEILAYGATPTLRLAAIELVRAGALASGTAERVVVEPSGSLGDLMATLGSVGRPEHLHVGFLEHGSHAEAWPAQVEATDDDGWRRLLVELAGRGQRTGLAMAFPACATLQFSENRSLEEVRARSDVAFRSLTGTASMMCSDNVSGYAAVDDARPFTRRHVRGRRRAAIRYDRLLLLRNV